MIQLLQLARADSLKAFPIGQGGAHDDQSWLEAS
jgi:hypothetical protein